MDYEELIEDDGTAPDPEPEDLDADIDEDFAEPPKAKSPWKAFILTGLIASLFGAAGGGFGVYQGVKLGAPKADSKPAIDITSFETKLDGLSKRVTAAEAMATKAANQPIPEAEPIDLSGLEARLETLESAPSPEIDPKALSALQSAQADGFEWPDVRALEERLDALEALPASADIETTDISIEMIQRLEDLEAKIEANQIPTGQTVSAETQAPEIKRLKAIEARLSALENKPEPTAKIERVSLAVFPKSAMMSAVEENVEGGLFKKALSKHVRVKDDDDPVTLIEAIEADISEGRLESATKTFERLPEPVRAAGQAWYDSVKASL